MPKVTDDIIMYYDPVDESLFIVHYVEGNYIIEKSADDFDAVITIPSALIDQLAITIL